ncbi:MAG TPA: HAD-IA family hydrolase [Patescibacteria group bacterium]|nr:HAD-IA family hydrolase [Patescibacteria group bacterium]
MQKPRAIVFDADGTLFDTFELIVSAYKHVAETHGLRVPSPEEVRVQLGKALPDIFRHFYPDLDIDMLLHTNNEYFAANTMNSDAFEGVAELLADLKAQGIKLAILTGGGSKVHDVIRQHGLETYFSSVVHHERVKRSKPDPEGFLLACRECGVEPGQTIMVGDTVQDIEAGKNAGAFATIAVTHGFGLLEDLQNTGPSYIVSDIAGIKEVISKLIY